MGAPAALACVGVRAFVAAQAVLCLVDVWAAPETVDAFAVGSSVSVVVPWETVHTTFGCLLGAVAHAEVPLLVL